MWSRGRDYNSNDNGHKTAHISIAIRVSRVGGGVVLIALRDVIVEDTYRVLGDQLHAALRSDYLSTVFWVRLVSVAVAGWLAQLKGACTVCGRSIAELRITRRDPRK